ncbi:unnamed protein product [Mytilus coruscus]|uniref:Choice-of-anchor I domain-containing protein n=1 Tax=Mytilus coruscus TaxID=42192 RepID=A0A6J8ACA5_MYTCO|nr:unnamed protein product [Mytilus coruscus]
MAFTGDCHKLVIANEGRGGLDGTFVDPPGSVSILIGNSLGSPTHVNIGFQSILENREDLYQSSGVRWVYKGDHNAGIVNNMWDDLEPDKVTLSYDERFAYVSLPENNAIARIDIESYTVNQVLPLGLKNLSLYRTDCSDQDGGANLLHYPIYAMYQPTDIALAVLNNKEYIVSANQGVIKRYAAVDGLTNSFDESERARQISLDNDFDQSAWPASLTTAVNSNQQLGRLLVRESDARDPITQRIKDITAYGTRSFSLWSVYTMQLAYDTVDELETKENEVYPNTFNGDVSNGNQSPLQQKDLRSDDHGPEPTALAVGQSGTIPLIVIGTRTGAIHLYAEELFGLRHQSVHREGQTSQTWNVLYDANQAGDAIITDVGRRSYEDLVSTEANEDTISTETTEDLLLKEVTKDRISTAVMEDLKSTEAIEDLISTEATEDRISTEATEDRIHVSTEAIDDLIPVEDMQISYQQRLPKIRYQQRLRKIFY